MDFNNIPAGWKLPLVSIEVDPSQAGTPTQTLYALLAGIMLSTGATGVANQPIAVASVATAKALFGDGSPLARSFEKFFAINRSTPVFCLPISEPSAGVKASGAITVTSAPTAAGTLALYIAGQLVSVAIGATDTANTVAANINTAINAATSLPVTSTVSTNAVTLTSKFKGIVGNDIRVEANVLGPNGGEQYPTGMALTFPANNTLASGTGTPDWSNAIAAIEDENYEYVSIGGHTDSGSISAWSTEYGFGDTGRWGWMRQTYGHVISAKRDTYANLMSWGPTSGNSGVITVEAVDLTSPSPTWEWAATFCARAARALANDPARPLQTLTQDGIIPAPRGFRFNKTELNALAGVGLAVQTTNSSGVPMIVREQTTYQKNSLGQADNAYELMTTLATLAALFRRLTQAITNKYPRHKLANDGTRFGPGQAIVTPNTVRAELVAEYRAAEYQGLVENVKAFKNALIVERDPDDPNRLNVLYPPDLVNQLRMFAVLAQFRLQFPTIDPAV